MARGRIVVDERYCKGCELCVAVCPFQLIEMSIHYNARGYRPATLADPDRQCTGCMLCAMICPDAAITVFREIKPNPDEPEPKKKVDPQKFLSKKQASNGLGPEPVRDPLTVANIRGEIWR